MTADLLPFGLDEGARTRLLTQLYDVQERIEECEAKLSDSMERIESFRVRWLEELGELLVECSQLRAQVAAAAAQSQGDDEQAAADAYEAESRAQQARAEWDAVGAPSEPRVPPSDDLKALYREAARRFHPDLASDPDDCTRRTEVMARVNAAYSKRDADTLRHILSTPEEDEDLRHPSSDQQLVDSVAAAWRRLDDLERAESALEANDYWLLLVRDQELDSGGRSLIDETRQQLEAEMAALRKKLQRLSGR